MWLRLTSFSGRTVFINADKATDIHEEENGSQVFFKKAIHDKDGNIAVGSLRVKESFREISEALQTAADEVDALLPPSS